MHRIDTSTVEADKWGAGKDGFTEGDPSTGVAATQISDDWLDAVQEEIIAPIEALSIALDTSANADVDQLWLAMKLMRRIAPACNYTERANGKNFSLYGVVARPSTATAPCEYVAVGAADGADSYILTSRYGVVWTERSPTVAKNINLNAVADSGSLFVAVGNDDGGDAYILSSPDGITWTERANAKRIALYGVAYSITLGWVAVGGADGTDSYILTSPDGVTWTERANPKNFALYSVAWSSTSGRFVAVGEADGTDAYVVTSTNGTTWTEVTNAKNFALRSVVYDYKIGLWVAVGAADGTDAYIITSTTGATGTWTERSNPRNVTLNAVSYDEVTGLLVAPGYDGSENFVYTSVNGITWYTIGMTIGTASNIFGVCNDYIQGSWVAVGGAAGGDAIIMQSNYASLPG